MKVLNLQAIDTTECVREAGWNFPDPVPEEHGLFLQFDAAAIPRVAPKDPEEGRQFMTAVVTCFDSYAVDWEKWVRDNPRHQMGG